ncbi:hypothetical protein ID866_10161 [Astraeus odoratus]|nr:hypothetical protein ID866_10161 [Astraeus odoratus]
MLQWISKHPTFLERCRLFLHDRIKYLIVSCVRRPQDSCGPLLADICARAPNLHTLELQIPNPVDIDMTSHIKIVACNLPKLARLILPEFYYTSAVIEELSRMENLEIIDIRCALLSGCGNPKNVESFSPILEEGAFPALRDLSITTGIDDMERFFQAKYAPINLTALYVHSYKMHTPEEVHSFLLTLSRACQCLSSLCVMLLEKDVSPTEVLLINQLTYATLQPLFSFPGLTWFKLTHKYPVRITLEEVEDLASRWPSLAMSQFGAHPLW